MSPPISRPDFIRPLAGTVSSPVVQGGPARPDFSELLGDAVRRVEEYRKAAETGVEDFLRGEREDLHTVALGTERADLAFELFLQTRNKVVQAYQEIMRMQV